MFEQKSGIYFLTNAILHKMNDIPSDTSGQSIWIYSNSNDDEQVGILVSAYKGAFYIGRRYGSYGDGKLIWTKINY